MTRIPGRTPAVASVLLIFGFSLFPVELADPVIIYSTYIGGTDANTVTGSAVDPQGNIFVVGHTTVADFPGVVPLQNGPGGSFDIFAAKINPNDGVYEWMTLVGGPSLDLASGFELGPGGMLYVTGSSFGAGFPTVDPIQSDYAGGMRDGVAFILDPEGGLTFSTYFGGDGDDRPQDVDLGPGGEFVIGGFTDSPDFPTKLASQSELASPGEDDAFIYIIDTVTGELFKSTYHGGSDRDRAFAISVDPTGNIWLGGSTRSTDLPLQGPFDDALDGESSTDGFLARFGNSFSNPADTITVDVSSFVGGSSFEGVAALDSDTSGTTIAVGNTGSDDFPLLINPFQPTFGGNTDVFFIFLGPDGVPLNASYLGLENDRESGQAVVATNDGCALVAQSAVTLGTSDFRAEVRHVCQDGTAAEPDVLGLGTPSDISLAENGEGVVVSGRAAEGGIETTPNAVQPEPPTEDDGSDMNNGYVSWFFPTVLQREPTTLEVTKTPSTNVTVVGASIDWVIEVSNTGNVEAVNVVVEDQSGGLHFADPETGRFGPPPFVRDVVSGDAVSWTIPSIPPGSTQRLSLRSNVNGDGRKYNSTSGDFEGPGIVENAVTATASNAPRVSFKDSLNVSPDDELFNFVLIAVTFQRPEDRALSKQPFVDVYLADSLMVDDIDLGTTVEVSGVALHSVTPKLDLVAATEPDNSAPLLSDTLNLSFLLNDSTLAVSHRNLMIVGEDGDQLTGLTTRTNFKSMADNQSMVDFFLVNFTDLPVDLLTEESTGKTTATIFAGIEPEQVSAYASLDPAPYSFLVLPAGEETPLGRFRVNWSTFASEALTVALTGTADSIQATILNAAGQVVTSVPVPVEVDEPESVSLKLNGNYPNPFSETTTVSFDLPEAAHVHVEVFDVLGRRVSASTPRLIQSGFERSINLSVSDLPSGTYLYRVVAEGADRRSSSAGRLVVLN